MIWRKNNKKPMGKFLMPPEIFSLVIKVMFLFVFDLIGKRFVCSSFVFQYLILIKELKALSQISEKSNILNVKFFHCTTDVSFKSFNVDQKRQKRLDSDRHSRLLSSKSYSNWGKKNIPWGLTLWLVMLSLIHSIPQDTSRIGREYMKILLLQVRLD